MTETKKSTSHKRIMDVAHPGKSAPSASSKPVIVTNRPILKDPMMLDEAAKPEGESISKTVSRKVEVKPADAPTSAPEVADPKAADKTIAQLAEEAAARDTKKPAPEPKPEESKEPKEDKEDTTESSDVVTPAAEEAADEEAKLDETAKQDAALNKLVESKQYFLPINAVEKRRTKRVMVLGILLSVILAAVWVDIALDAGIIQLDSVKPVTHFFSN